MQLFPTETGTLYIKSPGEAVLTQVDIPTGVIRRGYRTSFARTRRTSILNGRFDPGLAWYDHVSLLRKAGMAVPVTDPSVADNGAGNIDGIVLYYYTWLEMSGSDELAESSVSGDSNSLTLSSRKTTVTVPAVPNETRATHVVIYRSDDGDVPKRVGMVTVGTTTFADNIATGARGLEVPVYSDGSVIPDSRDPVAFHRFCFSYQRRVWYAGNLTNPHRAARSLIDEPEAVPAEVNYLDTLGREAITGIGGFRDQIIFLCSNVIYETQGYEEDDFVVRKLVDGIGGISHHSIAYDEWGRMWFCTQNGAYMYDGQFHHMMANLIGYWREEYLADQANFENCVGYIDKQWRTYNIMIPGRGLFFVGAWHHLDPSIQAESDSMQPAWSVDVGDRVYTAAGVLVEGENLEQVYWGDEDGYLYKANIDDDPDDAGDTYEKQVVIITGHFYTGDQRGGYTRGSAVVDLNLFLKSDVEYDVSVFSGADTAIEGDEPTWGPYTYPATVVAGQVDNVEKHIRPRRIAGKGHTLRVRAAGSTDFEWRGHNFGTGPGAHGRLAKA